MEIRDPIHRAIKIPEYARSVIHHPIFQRLRRVRQLGFTEYSFPGATHTRFLHSLGAFHLGKTVMEQWIKGGDLDFISETARESLLVSFSLACLCHDLGHPPFSHALESFLPSRHEEVSASLFEKHFMNETTSYVPKLLRKDADFSLSIEGYDFTPLVLDLLSGDCDIDRMDYLLRDSYFCGVAYGSYDLTWILSHLKPKEFSGKKIKLTLGHKAIGSLEDFLLSRYHMFSLVYLHHRGVILEKLTSDMLREESFKLDLDNYEKMDDHLILRQIEKSRSYLKKHFPRGLDLLFESRNSSDLPQNRDDDMIYLQSVASLKNVNTLMVENNLGEFNSVRESSDIISTLPTELKIHRLFGPEGKADKTNTKIYVH